jgi:hypothetical protein
VSSSLTTAELVGGPQDGGKVTIGGGTLPYELYVGPRWLGDGYAAWSRERSDRFPCLYRQGAEKYFFVPNGRP